MKKVFKCGIIALIVIDFIIVSIIAIPLGRSLITGESYGRDFSDKKLSSDVHIIDIYDGETYVEVSWEYGDDCELDIQNPKRYAEYKKMILVENDSEYYLLDTKEEKIYEYSLDDSTVFDDFGVTSESLKWKEVE